VNTVLLPPMPTRIARLPRDRRGYPVPYVSGWSSDKDSEFKWARERVVLPQGITFEGSVVQVADTVGVGAPKLGVVEPGRQLDCHRTPRCNVCGEVIGHRLTFVGGRRDPQCFTEAPLHRECARWALAVCPGLLAAQWDPDHTLVVVEAKRADVWYDGEFIDALDTRAGSRRAFIAIGTATQFHGLITVRAFPQGRRWEAAEWLAERAS